MSEVTYGFQRDNQWIEPTLRYTFRDLAGLNSNDDDPGGIKPNADISGAHFSSYMSYSSAYWAISENERDSFRDTLPFNRTGAAEPGINGYLCSDKTYSSGGKAIDRSSVKNY